MTFVKINDTLYPSMISGKIADKDWDNRASKSITLEMTYDEAIKLFVDGIAWSIVQKEDVPIYDEDGNEIGMETHENEFDNSEYNLAGDITDHRDGRITVKMGKLTELEEAYEIILGGVDGEFVTEYDEISEGGIE